MDFTRNNVRDLSEKFQKHMQSFLDEHDIDADFSGARFSLNEIRIKVTFKHKDGRSDDDIVKERFETLAGMIGMKREDWGKEFKMQNKTFIIWDIKPNARKNNVIIKEKSTDKLYVTSASSVNFQIS